MAILRFRAIPLTPIHIGAGQTITPENYLVEADTLVRFNPHAVLADMAPGDRDTYVKHLEQDRVDSAQELLRQRCRPEDHGVYRAAIGRGSKRELDELVRNPHRRCEVHPFQRNPLTGGPVVPGSSLKGAMRTAVVDSLVQEHRDEVASAVTDAKQDRRWRHRNEAWQRLERSALGFEEGHMECDPLRMFKVADCDLPWEAARVDQATLMKKGGDGRNLSRVQMHFERLVSRADTSEPPTFAVEMELDEREAAYPEVARLLGRKLRAQDVLDACNEFYWNRLIQELDHFFPGENAVRERVLQALGSAPATGVPRRPAEGEVLLRLGRFSHFESLSVDGLREGWNVQKRQPIDGMGATRTLCETADGGKVPFGWLLLVLEQPSDTEDARGPGGFRILAPLPPPRVSVDPRWAARRTARAEEQQGRAEQAAEEARRQEEAAHREAERARLPPEERALRELEAWLEEDRAASRREAGGRLANRFNELFRDADGWPREYRERLADLGEAIYSLVGWGNANKKQEKRGRLERLRGGTGVMRLHSAGLHRRRRLRRTTHVRAEFSDRPRAVNSLSGAFPVNPPWKSLYQWRKNAQTV